MNLRVCINQFGFFCFPPFAHQSKVRFNRYTNLTYLRTCVRKHFILAWRTFFASFCCFNCRHIFSLSLSLFPQVHVHSVRRVKTNTRKKRNFSISFVIFTFTISFSSIAQTVCSFPPFKNTISVCFGVVVVLCYFFRLQIDLHDIVLRFNHAPTKGHEKDVGSKTTIRVVNSQVSIHDVISDISLGVLFCFSFCFPFLPHNAFFARPSARPIFLLYVVSQSQISLKS